MRPTGVAVAVDIGGVIVQHGDGEGAGFLDEDTFLQAREVEGSYAALEQLVRVYGQENVFILSRARENVSRRSVEYFMHTRLVERTGVDPQRILFVRERAEKRDVMARLGIGLLIDDTWTVIRHVLEETKTGRAVWFGCGNSPARRRKDRKVVPKNHRNRIALCVGWPDTLITLFSTYPSSRIPQDAPQNVTTSTIPIPQCSPPLSP